MHAIQQDAQPLCGLKKAKNNNHLKESSVQQELKAVTWPNKANNILNLFSKLNRRVLIYNSSQPEVSIQLAVCCVFNSLAPQYVHAS